MDGLDLNHITFYTERPDYRPAVMLDDVKNESITDLKAPEVKGVKKVVKLSGNNRNNK